MAHEECDDCGHEYDFTPEVSTLNIFLNDPVCNFIFTTCPSCGVSTRIFLTADAIVHVVSECRLRFQLASDASEELRASARSLYGEPEPSEATVVSVVELTPRQESVVTTFGSAMDTIPVELFWECIEDDTDRPYPGEWR